MEGGGLELGGGGGHGGSGAAAWWREAGGGAGDRRKAMTSAGSCGHTSVGGPRRLAVVASGKAAYATGRRLL
jgi:hypothetical protein